MKTSLCCRRLTVLVGLACLLPTSPARAQTYTITELPPLAGFTQSGAYALNESGQAAGASLGIATVWTDGVPRSLQSGATTSSFAYALNDSGHAAGSAEPGINLSTSVIWRGSSMEWIIPADGSFTLQAVAMNNSDTVVGVGGRTFGYRWTSGNFQSLEALPGEEAVSSQAINNLGTAVGSSFGGPNGSRPVFWDSTTAQLVPVLPNSTSEGEALGINDLGQIVGEYWDFSSDVFRVVPFLWSAGAGALALPLPPGTTDGSALAINDAGTIIGEANGQPVLWNKNSTGTYEAVLVAPLVKNSEGWSQLFLNAINEAGQIAGDGMLNGVPRGFILTPGPAAIPTIEKVMANRDDPFVTWNDRATITTPQPVYAGESTGDLIAWRVNAAPSGATFKWTAVQTARLPQQTIDGPEGAGENTWALIDGSFNWPPGNYQISCVITTPSSAPLTLSFEQVVGWRSQEYLVVGQVKSIHDHALSEGRQAALVRALINSYDLDDTFISSATRNALRLLPTDENLKLWTAWQFLSYPGGGAPTHVPLHGVLLPEKYWMIQTLLNEFPDEVALPDILTPVDLTELRFKKSYRMFGRIQFRYLLNSNTTIDPQSVTPIRKDWDIGPTKFAQPPQLLTPTGTISVRGVKIDLQGNSNQSFISGETSPDSGQLTVSADGTAISFYFAGRVGLEGRVPNFALLSRDAPFIFTEIITAIGPDGRDTNSRIRLSVDKTWTPSEVSGNANFNEIRIFTRDYTDIFSPQFKLAPRGLLKIQGQLAPFLQSGSPTWPGLPPSPSIR